MDTISVLIIDDSALMRNLVGRIIERTPGLRIADKAMNGEFALAKIPFVKTYTSQSVISYEFKMARTLSSTL